MARGIRKTPMEKLTEQLNQVQESIQQYENCLETLKSQEKDLLKNIEQERFHEVTSLMKEKDLSIEDLRAWIEDQ